MTDLYNRYKEDMENETKFPDPGWYNCDPNPIYLIKQSYLNAIDCMIDRLKSKINLGEESTEKYKRNFVAVRTLELKYLQEQKKKIEEHTN